MSKSSQEDRQELSVEQALKRVPGVVYNDFCIVREALRKAGFDDLATEPAYGAFLKVNAEHLDFGPQPHHLRHRYQLERAIQLLEQEGMSSSNRALWTISVKLYHELHILLVKTKINSPARRFREFSVLQLIPYRINQSEGARWPCKSFRKLQACSSCKA